MGQLNGSPATVEQMQVLALVNYGHFTSMRVDDQHVRGLSLHLERLVRDCRTLFEADLDRERTREYIRRAIRDRPGSFMVRVTVFDPALGLGRPSAGAQPHVLVTTRPVETWPLPPMRVQSINYVRTMQPVKHVGLFGQLWHRRRAQLAGYGDALFLEAGSRVSEGVTWNIGFFNGDHVVWPDAAILPGVTMRLLQRVHDRTTVAPVTLADASTMEGAFATSSGIGVRSISAIDDQQFPGDHPIMDTLRKEYAAVRRSYLVIAVLGVLGGGVQAVGSLR